MLHDDIGDPGPLSRLLAARQSLLLREIGQTLPVYPFTYNAILTAIETFGIPWVELSRGTAFESIRVIKDLKPLVAPRRDVLYLLERVATREPKIAPFAAQRADPEDFGHAQSLFNNTDVISALEFLSGFREWSRVAWVSVSGLSAYVFTDPDLPEVVADFAVSEIVSAASTRWISDSRKQKVERICLQKGRKFELATGAIPQGCRIQKLDLADEHTMVRIDFSKDARTFHRQVNVKVLETAKHEMELGARKADSSDITITSQILGRWRSLVEEGLEDKDILNLDDKAVADHKYEFEMQQICPQVYPHVTTETLSKNLRKELNLSKSGPKPYPFLRRQFNADWVPVLQSTKIGGRTLNNKQVAAVLGISAATVSKFKKK